MKQIKASTLSDLPNIAQTILSELQGKSVFAFNGIMGAGKTTLIKAFCDQLGVTEVVTSPTFAIVNEYKSSSNNPVYHFDFYRIKKIDEVFDIGYEEYFYSNNYCFIEWPELVSDLLPETYVYILIEEVDNGERLISYEIR